MAPEQVGDGELTGQVDIYALGATLYEFLAGERAFPQTTVASILSAKMSNTYKPLAPAGNLTKDIIAVIDRSMAANPKDRYPTALAFRNDLEKALRPLCKPDGFVYIRELVEKGMKK
jgi:serine/threonine protein kinase